MKNKGFTMIELLAAVVVLGILSVIAIASVTSLKDKAKAEDEEVYKKSLKMAAETYLQSNKSQYPRTVGQHIYITSEFLTEKKYLKEDKGGYVIVRKKSNNDYEYEVVPNKKGPDSTACSPKPPTPKVEFTDSQLNPIGTGVSNNFEEATLHIEMDGGTYSNDDPEHPGEKVQIAGYSYKLYAKTEADPNLHEVYNSGSLPANGNTHLSVIKPVKEHIEITGLTYITAKVEVVNDLGCSYPEVLDDSGSEEYDAQGSYKDTIPPTCIKIEGQSDTWIKKGNADDSRTITATCDDGKGSGCVRPKFSRSWPNDDQPDAEWGYVQVKDNAGNVNLSGALLTNHSLCETPVVQNACRVKVNVDKTLPTIKVLGAYKADSNGKQANTTNTSTKANFTVQDSDAGKNVTYTGSIANTEYNNLVGGWMNKNNYPYGVVYRIEISDNIHLDHWTWQLNDDLLDTKASSTVVNTFKDQYKNTGYASTVPNTTVDWSGNCGTRKKEILVGFKNEGVRKGKLTVYDKAGNFISLELAANLDRTAPPKPGISYSGTYQPNKWTNKVVVATGKAGDKVDNLSGPKNNNPITLAGWKEYRYQVKKEYDTSYDKTGVGDSFTFNETFQGKNTIHFKSCDKADNCSEYGTTEGVWVDFIYPKCTVSTDLNGDLSAAKWLGHGETATVKAVCTDTETYGAARQSSCYNGTSADDIKSSYSKLYDYDINTSKAGAKGVGVTAKIRDVAGNVTNCLANQTVKIDHQYPKCKITGESTTWAKSRTIKRTCSDPKKNDVSSECTSGSTKTDPYKEDNKTVKTVKFVNYTIKDNADNTVYCKADSYSTDKTYLNVYVDRQAPSCKGTKSHTTHNDGTHNNGTGNPNGITITYTCSDAGVGGYSCPSKKENVKKNQSHTVKDSLGNSMTCAVTVNTKTENRYRKKDAPATCSKSCCGYKTCQNSACGCKVYNSKKNCNTCGYYWSTSSYGCGGARCCCNGCRSSCSKNVRCTSSGYGNYMHNCTTYWTCRCTRYTKMCKTCRHSSHGCQTYYSCAAKGCGNKTCTSASCCGYKCGTSHWNAWGGSSNGCKHESRTLYY